jgi:hypothetical protein
VPELVGVPVVPGVVDVSVVVVVLLLGVLGGVSVGVLALGAEAEGVGAMGAGASFTTIPFGTSMMAFAGAQARASIAQATSVARISIMSMRIGTPLSRFDYPCMPYEPGALVDVIRARAFLFLRRRRA